MPPAELWTRLATAAQSWAGRLARALPGRREPKPCPHTIRLVDDFHPRPFGRYREEGGERSGEVFREDHLIPALRAHDRVVVDLSGYNYYGSSFLLEAFGGLLRRGFGPDELCERLEVIHKPLSSIECEVTEYLRHGEPLIWRALAGDG